MMAWLDDRIWCHHKFTDLSSDAFRAYINAVAYSSGMHTRGHLSAGQQTLVRATPEVQAELVQAGLWDLNGAGGVVIHDWDEHNAKRDIRRAKDRDRKRKARADAAKKALKEEADLQDKKDVPVDAPADSPQDAPAERPGAEGSDGSEGSDKPPTPPVQVDAATPLESEPASKPTPGDVHDLVNELAADKDLDTHIVPRARVGKGA